MVEKTCVGCGKKFEKGYFVADDFARSEGWLCEECFEQMCFNKIKNKINVLAFVLFKGMTDMDYKFILDTIEKFRK